MRIKIHVIVLALKDDNTPSLHPAHLPFLLQLTMIFWWHSSLPAIPTILDSPNSIGLLCDGSSVRVNWGSWITRNRRPDSTKSAPKRWSKYKLTPQHWGPTPFLKLIGNEIEKNDPKWNDGHARGKEGQEEGDNTTNNMDTLFILFWSIICSSKINTLKMTCNEK